MEKGPKGTQAKQYDERISFDPGRVKDATGKHGIRKTGEQSNASPKKPSNKENEYKKSACMNCEAQHLHVPGKVLTEWGKEQPQAQVHGRVTPELVLKGGIPARGN